MTPRPPGPVRQRHSATSSQMEAGGEPAHWLGLLQTALDQTELAELPEMAWRQAARPSAAVASSAPDRREPGAVGAAGEEDLPGVGQYRPPAARKPISAMPCTPAWNGSAPTGGSGSAGPPRPGTEVGARVAAIARASSPSGTHRRLRPAAPARPQRNGIPGRRGKQFSHRPPGGISEEIWVLDYKTGGLDEPDPARRALPHLDQIDAYRHAARQLYPRPAGALRAGVRRWRGALAVGGPLAGRKSSHRAQVISARTPGSALPAG